MGRKMLGPTTRRQCTGEREREYACGRLCVTEVCKKNDGCGRRHSGDLLDRGKLCPFQTPPSLVNILRFSANQSIFFQILHKKERDKRVFQNRREAVGRKRGGEIDASDVMGGGVVAGHGHGRWTRTPPSGEETTKPAGEESGVGGGRGGGIGSPAKLLLL